MCKSSQLFFPRFQAKKAKLPAKDEDVQKPEQEDVDDEVEEKPQQEDIDDEVEEKPELKPLKKTFPARFTEKGLWRVHNAVFRVSFLCKFNYKF